MSNVLRILYVCLYICLLQFGCLTAQSDAAAALQQDAAAEKFPEVVTQDIQEGIEKHISEQTAAHNGYFVINDGDRQLRLELVRIHTEYLASLGPTRHFACVDMVNADGVFYDVDFFMYGPRGNMKVTETTIHKINGKPLYVWKQGADKSWDRVPVDKASKELLGVLGGRDKFSFRYQANIPPIAKEARMWIPLAQSDEYQNVRVESIVAPVKYETLTDSEHGNKALFFVLGPEQSNAKVIVDYEVERAEKSAYKGDPKEALSYLAPEIKVQNDPAIKAIAEGIVLNKMGQVMRARALYDYIIDTMAYKRCGIGWGQGDVSHAQQALSGNCTDFHSYFIALARSVGIPARFAIGASIPSERDEGGVDGYHCWAEFYADGKWWPVDISEANKFTALSMYYFGHHPANRFEFSHGRDLVVNPGPKSGPINFLAYPVLEIDGKLENAKIEFSFAREFLDKS